MLKMTSTLLACTLLCGVALAAGKPQPAFKPQAAPAAADAEAAAPIAAPPAAPMAQPVIPPGMSAESMIKSLSAIKKGRDGSETKLDAPVRVQRMLMGKQSGKIGGGGTGTGTGDDKKKGKLTQISKTTDFPYSTIGVVASGCSGALVMKRFVLTAAWCVYDVQNKKFYDNLDFYPGMNGKKTPLGTVKWKNAWVAQGFVDSQDLAFAYGLIELEEDLGDKVGWFGYGPTPTGKEKQFTLTGYPFDGVPATTMWETKCGVDAAEENAYFYRCPGEGKSLATMLGSPVWIKGKADDAWQIVGIHVTSQDDKKNSWWAQRLTAAHTETILGWANSGTTTEEPPVDDEEDQVSEEEDGGGTTEVSDGNGADCTCDEQASPQ